MVSEERRGYERKDRRWDRIGSVSEKRRGYERKVKVRIGKEGRGIKLN